MKPNVVQGERHRTRDVLWVLGDELQELFDVLGTSLVQGCVVDVDHNLLKVVVFLLPLQQVLSLLIVAEVLEEDQHCQMLEVALLKDK